MQYLIIQSHCNFHVKMKGRIASFFLVFLSVDSTFRIVVNLEKLLQGDSQKQTNTNRDARLVEVQQAARASKYYGSSSTQKERGNFTGVSTNLLKAPVGNESLVLNEEEEEKLVVSVETSESESENERTNDSKFCVIHAGPHKTGSSSLQVFMMQSKGIKDALSKDNYKIPTFRQGPFAIDETTPPENYNPKNHAVLAHCLLQNTIYNIFCPPDIANETMDDFESFVTDASSDGSNILLSSEAFDRSVTDIKKLVSYLEPHNYNIHFVLYYRRFHDWIYSTYYQQMGKHAMKGVNVQTFPEWLEEKLEESQLHYTVSTYKRLKSYPNFNVSIVNMHQDESNFNIVESFFCDHLDDAPHACGAAKSEKPKQINTSSNNMDWHLFRVKLPLYYSVDLSDDKLKHVEEKFSSMTDVPRTCLTPDWNERLLKLSIDMEIESTPERWHQSDEGLDSLKSDFEQKAKTKLCFVDTETVVKSPEWQDFLANL